MTHTSIKLIIITDAEKQQRATNRGRTAAESNQHWSKVMRVTSREQPAQGFSDDDDGYNDDDDDYDDDLIFPMQ